MPPIPAAFPPPAEFDTVPVLKALKDARVTLTELNARADALPNPAILLDTLFLQEALVSSEIENIVTTQDEVFRAEALPESGSVEAKEVARYCEAMRLGFAQSSARGFISENMLIEMYRLLKQRADGYRKVPGTVIRNQSTGETVHTPPQHEREIIARMKTLADYINQPQPLEPDPLVRMALIHHEFESIHPFHDGNGRIGRMLNVLYLTHTGLLDAPVLYLSRAINRTKPDYYRLLQSVRDAAGWREWVLYMLRAVEDAAAGTLRIVGGMRALMREYKIRMRGELPKIYSQELLNNLFRHPYTRIELVGNDTGVERQTARKYLAQLTRHGFVEERKHGRNKYYVNQKLVDIFHQVAAA